MALRNLFQKYGNVLECVVMWNHYGFIHYENTNEARNGLLNLHGYLFEGKHLIVQFSTSSNRPLPKCKVFETKQSGMEFIKSVESSLIEFQQQHEAPATILCYRASDADLESEMLPHQEPNVTTMNANKKIEKDWIKILSQNIQMSKLEISLSDIPTPNMPLIQNKIQLVPIHDAATLGTNYNDIVSLDQVPTPPLPIDFTSSTGSSYSSKVVYANDTTASSSSSVDISEYLISSSDSVSPYTLSLDEEIEEMYNYNRNRNDIYSTFKNPLHTDTCC